MLTEPAVLRSPMKPLGIGVAMIAAGAIVLFAAVGVDRAPSLPAEFTTYCVGLLYLGALAWTDGTRRRRPQGETMPAWLSPPALVAGWTLVWIYGPALAAFVDDELLGEIAVVQGGHALLTSGVLLACVALTALWGAYHATGRLLGRCPAEAGVRHASLHRIVGLYILSVAARALRVSVVGVAFGAEFTSWGALAAVDQWIGYIEDLRYLALALLVASVVRNGTGRPWLAAALAVEVVFAATSGFIKPFIWPVVVCMATAAALDRVRARHVVGVAAAVVVAASFTTVVNVIRQDWGGGIGTTSNAGLGGTLSASLGESRDAGAVAENAYRKFFGRQTEVASSTGLIVALTPTVLPFEGLEQFLYLPVNLVPRVFWPGKPILSRGQWFSVYYRGLNDDTTSSSAMTMFGEGFLFFGWIGVCLGMTILGGILAILYRVLGRTTFLPVYLALLPTILEIEPELSSYLTSLVQRSVVFIIVFVVFTYRSRALRPARALTR